MKRKLLFVLSCLFFLFTFLQLIPVKAEGEYTRNLSVYDVSVSCNDVDIKGIYTNPAQYNEDSASGYLVSQNISLLTVSENDKVIYTALFPRTTTNRSGNVIDYVCENNNGKYYVTKIDETGLGNTYIPVNGFVLSLPKATFASFAEVGDEVKLNNKLFIPSKAVESNSGKRIVVDKTNTTRSGPMVVYYDYQFGEKTGTNIYGTEMTCTYDFDKNCFIVKNFRNFGTGDDSGSAIPENSFVLSAYGEGYRSLLVKGELFNLDDEVKMVGFDFIRFGGTTIGDYQYVNPTKESNPKGMETETSPFPAYRGENQTIIYKDGWSYNGANGTGTNVYGYEASVDANGVVVELNVNVSSIPEGGYVISGHGSGRDFIRSNIVLGATIVLDEESKTFAVSTTLNSYYQNLVVNVNNVIKNAETKVKQLYDVDKTLINNTIETLKTKIAAIETVKTEIENGIENNLWNEDQKLTKLMTYNTYQIEIEKLEHLLIASSVETKSVAAKSVWHRPIEMSYADIENTMKLYEEIGINLIFVETLYGGYSTFKSKYNDLFPYNTKLADNYSNGSEVYNDYMSCFVASAKKHHIEVQAWVENFYVGTQNTVSVVQNHPDWIMYNDDDTYLQRNEGGLYIFIDPANKEVQDALINYYKDLFEKIPDCAGLNLDYIRYPVTDRSEDSGYTLAAMQGFAELKGMSFSDAQKKDRAKMAKKFKQLFDKTYLVGGEEEATKNYEEWVNYRTALITSYVKRIKEEVKDVYKIQLSTAVFASINDSLNMKKQDWKTWISNGWIDIATPMAYYNDATDVLVNVDFMISSAGSNAFYYSGLASSYSGLPAFRNTEQIEASYQAGALGYVIFCSTQIIGHSDVQEVLKAGVNSKKAMRPTESFMEVIETTLSDIVDRAERIYIPAGGMSEEQLTLFKNKKAEILSMKASSTIELYKVQLAVKELYENGISTYAKGFSGQRITEQLKYLDSILETKISLNMIANGEWNPEIYPLHPTITNDSIIMNELPSSPTEPLPSDPTDPVVPSPNPSSINPLMIIIPVVAVVAAGTALVVCVYLKKKNNKN